MKSDNWYCVPRLPHKFANVALFVSVVEVNVIPAKASIYCVVMRYIEFATHSGCGAISGDCAAIPPFLRQIHHKTTVDINTVT